MVELPAPAKVNLHLHVTGLREDGRHTLDTSFAFVDLCDTLHFRTASELQVSCSDPALNGEANLVYQLLQALRQQAGIRQGVHVHIDKRIPEQAGLGGGSSDAATALLAACQLWQLAWSRQQLMTLAAAFGADIPCFLFGCSALADDAGDRLRHNPEPLPAPAVCLARPHHGLSTSEVFRCWDTLTEQKPLARVRATSGRSLPLAENDLEPVAIQLLPAMADLLAGMRRHGRLAWMTGSGSCCLALCEDVAKASTLADELRQRGLADWACGCRLLAQSPLSDALDQHATTTSLRSW